jgi:hypothetical protein
LLSKPDLHCIDLLVTCGRSYTMAGFANPCIFDVGMSFNNYDRYDESVVEKRSIMNMGLRAAGGLTYMHYQGTPIYPYGWGLAYTTWSLSLDDASTSARSASQASKEASVVLTTTTVALASDYDNYYSPRSAGNAFNASTSLAITVANTGDRMSSVVVQLFATMTQTSSPTVSPSPTSMPLRQLVGFEREADVAVGERRKVAVGLAPLALCMVDADGNQWAEPATWALAVTVDGAHFANATLVVTGQRQQVLSWPDASEY